MDEVAERVPAERVPAKPVRVASTGVGWVAALASACAFGTSGAFAKPLLAAGWSAGAVVAVRLGLAALILLGPGLIALRGQWRLLRAGWRPVLGYGVFGGATAQVAFFSSVQYVPVALGLLIEYLGVLLVVGWVALRRRRLPSPVTLVGVAIALTGLVVLLDPTGMGAVLDPRGIGWGALAALGLAVYFIVAAGPVRLPPVTFVGFGLAVGTLTIVAAGVVGLMPLQVGAGEVTVGGLNLPAWVPLVELAVIAAAGAYLLGFVGAQRLGSTLAGFIGLTEVLFAVGWAWLLLGELPGRGQLLGGLVLLAGVAIVQRGQQS